MSRFKELEIKTIKKIEQLQDFHVFTGFSYDRYGRMLNSTYEKGTIYNSRTHTTVSDKELSKILLKYLDEDLPKIVIYQLVSYFDDFLIEFLEPMQLNRRIGLENNLQELRKKMNISTITTNDVKRLMELRESRHVVAHRSGIVDERYIKNVGSFARAQLNNPLTFSRSYVYDSADFVKSIIHNLTKAAIGAKLSKD